MKKFLVLFLVLVSVAGCSLRGKRGRQGKPGLNGSSCTVTSAPLGAIITCTDGTSQLVSNGTNGSDGQDGNDGSDGTDGTNGTNATPITVVNLCPGVTSYPSTFVEVAFCMNNELYAVYSQNNGFLVKLPPGNYTSNAHGSTCTLIVQPNCVITH